MIADISKLTITQRLYAIALGIMFCMGVIGLYTLVQTNTLAKINQDFIYKPYTVSITVRDIENGVLAIERDIGHLLHAHDEAKVYTLKSLVEELDDRNLAYISLIENKNPEYKATTTNLRRHYLQWQSLHKKIYSALSAKDHEGAEKLIHTDHASVRETMIRLLDTLKSQEVDSAFKTTRQIEEAHSNIIWQVIVSFLVLFGVSSLLIYFIARSIVNPTIEIANSMKDIAQSPSDDPIPHTDRHDEIGVMARATEIFRQNSYSMFQLNEELKNSDRVKSEFFANMNHEIRTPLNGILGMCQLLKLTELTDKQKRISDNLDMSGNILLELVNDLLDFAKMEAGLMEFKEVEFEIQETVDGVLATVSGLAAKKNLKFSCDISDEVKGPVLGDAVHVRQILINFAGNAAKFTEEGSITICVKPGDRDGFVHFRVIDTGVGIPEDKVNIVFDRFSQVDSSATRKTAGTGIGLTICRELVERMGGTIGVDSRIGEGSEFWFEVPLKRKVVECEVEAEVA